MRFCDIDTYYSENIQLIDSLLNEYDSYFKSNVVGKLSRTFYKRYLNYHGFHDWYIKDIDIKVNTQNRPHKYAIVTLTDNNKTVRLRYSNIRNIKINLNTDFFTQWSYDQFVLDEFIALDNGYISHEIVCPSGSYYYFEFKTVRFI